MSTNDLLDTFIGLISAFAAYAAFRLARESLMPRYVAWVWVLCIIILGGFFAWLS